MWYFMEESLNWYDGMSYKAPDSLDAGVLNRSDWDWEAVLIFTCSSSCTIGTDAVCIAQERVVAFNLASPSGPGGDLTAVGRLDGALVSERICFDNQVVDAAAAAAGDVLEDTDWDPDAC